MSNKDKTITNAASNSASPFSEQRRRVLNAAIAGGVAMMPTVSWAQAERRKELRVGYIGSFSKLISASGWALQQGYLARELAPLGVVGVSTHSFPNGPDRI
jgi:hypothetical protein